jgi:hypothetical protein
VRAAKTRAGSGPSSPVAAFRSVKTSPLRPGAGWAHTHAVDVPAYEGSSGLASTDGLPPFYELVPLKRCTDGVVDVCRESAQTSD